MKNFFPIWILLVIFAAGGMLLLMGLIQDAFWAPFLLATGLLAAAVTTGINLFQRLSRIENKLDALLKEKSAEN